MELKRLGVDIRFNTDATADMIRAENPDIVVLATGGRPGIEEDPAWGGDAGLAVSSWDILSGKVEVGENAGLRRHGSTCRYWNGRFLLQ